MFSELLLVEYVELVVGEVMVIEGSVVSGGVYVTVSTSVPVLLAASLAVTVITLVPLYNVIPLRLHEVVPLQTPLPPLLLDQVTWVTPTLSEAVPPMFSELLLVEYVELVVGEVMVIEGSVVSSVNVAVTVRA